MVILTFNKAAVWYLYYDAIYIDEIKKWKILNLLNSEFQKNTTKYAITVPHLDIQKNLDQVPLVYIRERGHCSPVDVIVHGLWRAVLASK